MEINCCIIFDGILHVTEKHEIKKMITTGMLKRQVGMYDDDEFDHIVKKLQRVLRLNYQYENDSRGKEFTKKVKLCLPMDHTV